MSDSSSTTTGGIGLVGFTFLIFLFLKLAEIGKVAAWSWWWVFSPLWITALVIIVIVIITFIIGLIAIALNADGTT